MPPDGYPAFQYLQSVRVRKIARTLRTFFLSAQQLVRAPRGVSGTAARSETDTTAKAAVTNDLGLIATTFLTGHRRYDTYPRASPGERLQKLQNVYF